MPIDKLYSQPETQRRNLMINTYLSVKRDNQHENFSIGELLELTKHRLQYYV